MSTKRYEHTTNGHYKFWTVRLPQYDVYTKSWGVLVTYGKIGTAGKDNWHFSWNESSAHDYYHKKIQEKLNKGYKLIQTQAAKPMIKSPAKPLYMGQPKPAPAPKKECEHNQLRKTAAFTWTCNACKTIIDFDKPQVGAPVIEESQVRRFFDLSAFKD